MPNYVFNLPDPENPQARIRVPVEALWHAENRERKVCDLQTLAYAVGYLMSEKRLSWAEDSHPKMDRMWCLLRKDIRKSEAPEHSDQKVKEILKAACGAIIPVAWNIPSWR